MDLIALSRPQVFAAPPLGEIAVDVFNGDFGTWFDGWAEAGGDDAQSLVRDLLRDQAARHGEPPVPLDPGAIATLGGADLDAVADALLEVAGGYYRPKHVSTPASGPKRKVRKRRPDEAYDLEAREGERGAQRLLRILTDWRQDRRDRDWMFSASARAGVADMMRIHRDAAVVQRLVDQQKALALVPAYEAALKVARLAAPLKDRLPMAVRPEIDAAIRRLSLGPALHLKGWQSPEIASIMTALKGAAVFDIAAATRFPNMGGAIGRLSLGPEMGLDPFGGIRRMQDTFLDVRRLMGPSIEMGRIWADQAELARTASRLFDLKIPAVTLAAIAALPPTGALSLGSAAMRNSVFPPGYQLVAGIGVASTAYRGVAADILQRYGEVPAEDAPVFGGALEATALIDAELEDPGEVVDYLERFAALAMAVLRNEADVIRRNGLTGVLTLVLAAIGAYYAWAAVAQAPAPAAAIDPGPANARMAAVGQQIGAVRQEVAGLRADRSDERLHIRYLHARAPLRAEPHGQGLVLRLVYPDQLIRVVGQRSDWVEADVFDYKSEAPIRGWIARSRLRQTPPE